ncbi:MAG TPA: hypothetical protein ENK18_21820 [Deltaproteobacteria bacterium]|nr:hypothetical protein [Deltaproteobacteria bacterium]
MNHIPRSGPLRLDCRTLGAAETISRIRLLTRRIRRRARRLEVQVDQEESLHAGLAWADQHQAPYQIEGQDGAWSLQIFLFPRNFGDPPLASLNESRLKQPEHHSSVTPELPPRHAAA